nr:Rz1 family lipoprotein [Xenorhabdus bovienii]
MLNLKLTLFGLMLPLAVASCTSKPSVPCLKPLPPPAWMMQSHPDWKTPLSGIISPS